MIYINDSILSSTNHRLKMLTTAVGSLDLREIELRALECHFPGVGIRWISEEVVEIPARPFKLTMTEGDDVVLELENCVFVPIDEIRLADDESTRVYFVNHEDTEVTCEREVGEQWIRGSVVAWRHINRRIGEINE